MYCTLVTRREYTTTELLAESKLFWEGDVISLRSIFKSMMSLVSNLIGAAGFSAAVTKIGLGLKPVLPFFKEDGHAHLVHDLYIKR